MQRTAAITVFRPREEVERLWSDPSCGPPQLDASVRFADAPGNRGTEIHLVLEDEIRGGKLGESVKKLSGSDPGSTAKDQLRRFKQLVETGVIARSDGTPDGESAARKLKQRPAQPLEEAPREKAGV
jgi:uncharacterized membrane protein